MVMSEQKQASTSAPVVSPTRAHIELLLDPWISSNYYVSHTAWQHINTLLIQLFIDMPFKQHFTVSYAQQYAQLVALYNTFEGDVEQSMLDYTVQVGRHG